MREIYDAGADRLLLVASDRISAYDHVLPTPIPDKGRVLTALSVWWFDQLTPVLDVVRGVAPPDLRRPTCPRRGWPAGRCWCGGWRCCRSSAWPAATCPGRARVEYQRTGAIRDVALPAGLVEGSRLPDAGVHAVDQGRGGGARRGDRLRRGGRRRSAPTRAEELRELTLALYRAGGARSPQDAGIVLADTKFEFGLRRRTALVLGDEVLTPDSSRFWPAATWSPGAGAAVVRQAVRPRLADVVRLGPRLRRRRSCPPTSSPPPASATSPPTSSSPAGRSTA